eukprot:2662294-Ditylum_brightwellii.AAC.1
MPSESALLSSVGRALGNLPDCGLGPNVAIACTSFHKDVSEYNTLVDRRSKMMSKYLNLLLDFVAPPTASSSVNRSLSTIDENEETESDNVNSSGHPIQGPITEEQHVFEKEFDAFLNENASLVPGGSSSLKSLREQLIFETGEKSRVELELKIQLDTIRKEKEETEALLRKEIMEVKRAKEEREREVKQQLEKMMQEYEVNGASVLWDLIQESLDEITENKPEEIYEQVISTFTENTNLNEDTLSITEEASIISSQSTVGTVLERGLLLLDEEVTPNLINDTDSDKDTLPAIEDESDISPQVNNMQIEDMERLQEHPDISLVGNIASFDEIEGLREAPSMTRHTDFLFEYAPSVIEERSEVSQERIGNKDSVSVKREWQENERDYFPDDNTELSDGIDE